MDDFLQTYGVWLLLGFLGFLMFRMHKGGGGCCGPTASKAPDENAKAKELEDANGRWNG